MKTFNHILVPTDFSETARDALRAARDLAKDTQARLTIAHVIPDAWQQAWVVETRNRIDMAGMERAWREGAETQLKALVDAEGLGGGSVSTVVLVGAPHLAITEYADSHQVDLMVVGTHGHGPIRRFVLGSVAERLIRAAHRPVLAIPHESLRAESPVTREPAAAEMSAAGATPARGADDQC
jgi:nucleotide-binding universal stress UspA family protein